MGYASRVKSTGQIIEWQSGGSPDVLLANALSTGLVPADVEVVSMSDAERIALTLQDQAVTIAAKAKASASLDAVVAKVPPGPVADAIAALAKMVPH